MIPDFHRFEISSFVFSAINEERGDVDSSGMLLYLMLMSKALGVPIQNANSSAFTRTIASNGQVGEVGGVSAKIQGKTKLTERH